MAPMIRITGLLEVDEWDVDREDESGLTAEAFDRLLATGLDATTLDDFTTTLED